MRCDGDNNLALLLGMSAVHFKGLWNHSAFTHPQSGASREFSIALHCDDDETMWLPAYVSIQLVPGVRSFNKGFINF